MDRGIFRQVLIGVVCNLLVIDSGLHEGWSTPMIPKFNNDDPLRASNDELAWIVNLLYVGVGLGSAMPFFLMDRIGRKKTLLSAAVPKVASWLLLGLATSPAEIFAGRVLAGIGCGITYAVMPMYLAEVSSKRTRGPLGAMMSVLLNIGMFLAYAIGLSTTRLAMSMIVLWVPVAFVLTFAWLPESSVFLTRKNKLSLAEKTLRWSLAKENVDEELDEIKRIVAGEGRCEKLSLADTLGETYRAPNNRRAFAIALILFSGLILTGAAPILAFQSFIFEEAGYEISTDLSIVITGCAIVAAGTACITLVKFTGKRLLLLIGAPICMISLGLVATFFTFSARGYDVSGFRWVPTVFLVVFVVGYGLALNPIPLSYIGEIFSVEMKVLAGLLCSLFYAIATSATVKFYQVLQEVYGTHAPIWVFAVITLLVWISIYLFVPETEGKTLEEIQMELRRKT